MNAGGKRNQTPPYLTSGLMAVSKVNLPLILPNCENKAKQDYLLFPIDFVLLKHCSE